MNHVKMKILRQTNELVTFNPFNREHVAAYLALAEQGRQHPTLRFELESPHVDVKAMMSAKMARAFASRVHLGIDETVRSLMDGSGAERLVLDHNNRARVA